MRKIDEIIVHCSATRVGQRCTLQDIDSWHRQRGFNCIGYHYLIYEDGTVVKGRPEEIIGAHAKGHNAHSIGVCYIGGLNSEGVPTDTRSQAQRRSLRNLIADLKCRYPIAVVHSHRDFAVKECPCFDATNEYRDL